MGLEFFDLGGCSRKFRIGLPSSPVPLVYPGFSSVAVGSTISLFRLPTRTSVNSARPF